MEPLANVVWDHLYSLFTLHWVIRYHQQALYLKSVCLDRCRAALLDGRTNLTAALSEDELTNGRNVHRLLRRQLISTNYSPIRSFHLLEQLCLDPCMRSLTPAQEVRLSAEFYHWLSNPVETSSSLAQDPSSEPFVVKPAIPDSAPSSSTLQNGKI